MLLLNVVVMLLRQSRVYIEFTSSDSKVVGYLATGNNTTIYVFGWEG